MRAINSDLIYKDFDFQENVDSLLRTIMECPRKRLERPYLRAADFRRGTISILDCGRRVLAYIHSTLAWTAQDRSRIANFYRSEIYRKKLRVPVYCVTLGENYDDLDSLNLFELTSDGRWESTTIGKLPRYAQLPTMLFRMQRVLKQYSIGSRLRTLLLRVLNGVMEHAVKGVVIWLGTFITILFAELG